MGERLITDQWARLALAFAKRAASGTQQDRNSREAKIVSAFLLCLANELICKAILRLRDPKKFNDAKLKSLGHDIPKFHRNIMGTGVELPSILFDEKVEAVFRHYQNHFYKYPNIFHILGAFDNVELDNVASGTLKLFETYDTLTAELSSSDSP